MTEIVNPILRGFNPDPSIVRVGEDYYLATSTFEWFPGVRLHHSRDLVHFRTLGYALTRTAQLDLLGAPSSGGVWAPCLSYDAGTFYLIYTNVKSWRGAYGFDTHNYLVTAPDILGPWSDPIYLHSRGFDPSLFHDADGRKWLVSMRWDYRPGKNRFASIELQEYSVRERKLTGPVRDIFLGTALGITEGPHLYRRGDYYYLITAEGGTSWNHAVTCARSRNLFGPYEVGPYHPVLSSMGHPKLSLQKAGHASLVETPAGDTYLAHLCARPVGSPPRCILGRETALQRAHWTDDGWLRLAHDDNLPRETVPAPASAPHPWPRSPARDEFDEGVLNVEFQTLRRPADPSWLSLTARASHLRLIGAESPSSRHRQSVVARRVQSLHCRAETAMEFAPTTFQTLAGLVCWYDTENHYYLAVTRDETLGRCLRLFVNRHGVLVELCEPVALPGEGRIVLESELNGVALRFYYAVEGKSRQPIGPECDATILSDEQPPEPGGFTGAFVGMAVHDVGGAGVHADFDYFLYEET